MPDSPVRKKFVKISATPRVSPLSTRRAIFSSSPIFHPTYLRIAILRCTSGWTSCPFSKDDIDFIHGEVTGVDISARNVTFVPAERGGAETHQEQYDYVVFAGGPIPQALAACEGPPIEVMMSMATWLKDNEKGGPSKIERTG